MPSTSAARAAPEWERPLSAARSATVVLGCAVGLAVAYLLAVWTALGQTLDDGLMVRAWATSPALASWSQAALNHYHEASYALVSGGVLLAGLLVRGPRRALAAAVTLGAVLASAEALKHGLPRPDLGGGGGLYAALADNSFPSGHTAGVAGLVAAVAVLVPARHRRLVVGLGVAAVLAVGAALVVAQWHRPSDVLGSVLLAGAWGAVGVAAAEAGGAPRRVSPEPLGRSGSQASNMALTTSRGTSSTRG